MKTLLLLPFLLLPPAAFGQTIISDSFDIAGNDSAATGFGTDGVNTDIATRLTGTAVVAEPLTWVATGAGKVATSYSIASNALRIDAAPNVGAIQFSNNGFSGFDFGPYLVGKRYEVTFTFDNDSVDTINRRMSWMLADAPNAAIGDANLGFQLQAEANQASANVFKRLSAVSNGSTTAVNASIASGLTYGDPVQFRVVIEDIDITGVQASSYEVYLNGSATPVDSGLITFIRGTRYLIFDIAPATGPCSIDDFSVSVTGPAAEPPDIGARYLYFVNSVGEIRSFTGITAGAVPVTGRFNLNGGVLEGAQPDYTGYQAFAIDPTTGIVYGINAFGDVVRWPTLADWFGNTNAIVPDFDDPGFAAYGMNNSQGSVHGASYDPATGGFYVVYEGDATIDGDVGHYASAADFLINANATVSASIYGGNLINFHYSGEDAPGNVNAATPGANYFHATSTGQIEGFPTLADYISNPDNRTFQQANFCGGAIDGFALPVPVVADLKLEVSNVQRNPAGEVVSVDLSWNAVEGTSYNLLGAADLATGFTVLPGYEGVATSPQTVTVPASFGSRGFFTIEVAP
jgi:hypothetical protein